MDALSEMMVISHSGSKPSFSVFDMKTGATVFAYQEGNCCLKGLALIGSDFFLSASKDKPLIQAWTASKRSFETCSMSVSGIVSCLAVNDVGDYCVAGIKSTIYVWEVSSGRMMNFLEYHSKTLTCLKFSSDGTFVISGGKDGLVLVWLFSLIVDVSIKTGKAEPFHVWTKHSGDVTDIHVGKLGIYARVASASRDKTCNLYDLESGELLTTICTTSEITAVTMDNTEYFLMLGCSDGKIYRVNMFSSRDGEVNHLDPESESVFVGHSDAVTSLSVSIFGKYLLSGSEDGCAILWNIINLASLSKKSFEGPVTNAFIALLPPGLRNDGIYIPKIPVKTFRKEMTEESATYIRSRITEKILSLMHTDTSKTYFDASMLLDSKEREKLLAKHKASPQVLDNVNKQLYSYALCDLVRLLPSSEAE